MNLNRQVNTAGAFVLVNGLFVFMVGPDHDGDLCVVRFGGHKENRETAIECLERELKEEASINVIPVNSPITYYTESWDEEPVLMNQNLSESISPIIIKGEENGPLSILYFAYSDEEPIPDSEQMAFCFSDWKI